MSIDNAEYIRWKTFRSLSRLLNGEMLMGTSSAPVGGSTTGTVSSAYENQQAGEFKDELKIDAGAGNTNYDFYRFLDNGEHGAPVTDEMEMAIFEAATQAAHPFKDTIPIQVQLALMLAARKAHNNWRQRRQQLLTHAQLRAANRLAIDADMEKMAAGVPLDGVSR